jgi:hypothetical protein
MSSRCLWFGAWVHLLCMVILQDWWILKFYLRLQSVFLASPLLVKPTLQSALLQTRESLSLSKPFDILTVEFSFNRGSTAVSFQVRSRCLMFMLGATRTGLRATWDEHTGGLPTNLQGSGGSGAKEQHKVRGVLAITLSQQQQARIH